MNNNSPFKQLCVWPATQLGDSTVEEFEQFFLDELNARVKFYKEVITLPDIDSNGNTVPDTGGRNDLFFYVHADDVGHFALPRLKMGIRWWEDVVGYNDNAHLYTKEFLQTHPLLW